MSAGPAAPNPGRIASYDEFWPFYLSQHLNPACRRLHFAGTTGVLACVAAAAARLPHGATGAAACLAAAPVAGYGFAWYGHFFCERNRPATFAYPLWSLRADFRMFRYMARGRLQGELKRLGLG